MSDDLLPEPSNKKLQTKQLQAEIENTFIDNLFLYRNPVIAARKAGYSKAYSKNIHSLKLRSPKFQARIKERYNGNAALILPDIFYSESSAIKLSNDMLSTLQQKINETDDIDQKVELANKTLNILAKASHTRKELKQTAGVLAQEGSPQINVVNIEKIQALINTNHADMLNKRGQD